MKQLLTLLLILPFLSLAQTTTPPEIEWQRAYGGSHDDGSTFSYNFLSYCGMVKPNLGNAIVLDDGSIVFISSVGFDVSSGLYAGTGDLADPPISFQRGSTGWLVKTSPQGSIIWKTYLNTPTELQFITKTVDGGFMLSGNTLVTTQNYPTDQIIVKVSDAGVEQWRKLIHNHAPLVQGVHSERITIGRTIQPTPDGGYILAGFEQDVPQNTSLSLNPICTSPTWANPWGYRKSIITKLDASGNIQWENCLIPNPDDISNFILDGKPTADGGYIVVGSATKDTANTGIAAILVGKINATGTTEWIKYFSGSGHSYGRSIFQTADGNYIVTGIATTDDGAYEGINPYGLNGTTGDASIAGVATFKLNATGGVIWKKVIGIEFGECNLWTEPTRDGGFIQVSWLYDGYLPSTPALPTKRTWITKHNANGDMEWEKNIGGSAFIHISSDDAFRHHGGQCIRETPDDGYIVFGYTYDNGGDVCGMFPPGFGTQKEDIWLCKLKNLPAPPRITGDTILVCTNTTTLTADQPTPQPTPPASYLWNTGATTQSISNVGAGTYFVTITYENRCTKSTSVTVQAGSINIPPANVSITPTGCNGQGGSATLNATGGSAPYTYTCASGSVSANIILGLVAGNYVVSITDNNGCTGTTNITIPIQNSTLNITSTITPTGCNGQGGSAMLNATGGSAPYTYTCVSGSVSANTITGLSTGNYVVSVTDANGCTGTTTIIIPTQNSTLNITNTTTPSGCIPSGTATFNTTNGSAPYTYTCASGSVSANTITGLGAGTYVVNVTDANGCTGTTSITIPQAANDLIATATATQIPCAGDTGSISVSVTNGIAPYTVTWTSTNGTNGSTTTTSNTVNLPYLGGGGGGFEAGDYTVVFTDNTGCTASVSTTINAAPLPLTATLTAQNTTCGQNNGSLTANINGGTAPYTLNYTHNGTIHDTTTTSNTVRLPSSGGAGGGFGTGGGFAAGLHSVSFSDVNGCSFASSATINGNPPITATITTTPTKCYGEPSGSVAISNVQNAVLPVLYSIDNQTLSATNPIVNVLGGTHTVSVQDATGCSLVATVIVAEGPKFEVYAGRDTLLNLGDSLVLSANIKSGFPLPPSTYSWTCTPGIVVNTHSASGQSATAYMLPSSGGAGGGCTVTLVDARGCRAEDALLIQLKDANGIFIPNTFTPNGDDINDNFVIFAGAMVERIVLLQIFDRWGALVHQKTDFAPNTRAWDGVTERYQHLQGVGNVGIGNVMQGVYVYRTEIRLRNGEIKTLTGDVTLLR